MKQQITIDLPYKVSSNKIYSTNCHWAERKRLKDLMRWALVPVIHSITPMTKGTLTFDFKFKSRPLDCSNCSFMAKMIEDVLVDHFKIVNDTPQYVKRIIISSSKGDRDVCLLTMEDEYEFRNEKM